jgi:hypothetical protein
MFVEFQVATKAFLDGILLSLQSQKIDFSQTITFNSQVFAIDHLEFGNNRLESPGTQQIPVYFDDSSYENPNGIGNTLETQNLLQLVQPVNIFLVNLADVESHPNGNPSVFYAIAVDVYYNIQYSETYYSQNYQDANLADLLTLTYDSNSITSLPLDNLGTTAEQLEIWTGGFFSNNPSGRIQQVIGLANNAFGGNLNKAPINTGMSFNLQMGILSFRQELGGGVPADWVSYYSGNLTSRMNGAIYAVYMDADCIEYQTQEQIYSSFEKHPNPQFNLVSGVSSVFSGTGGMATVNSTFGGNVNTPLCTIWTDVYLNSTLSVDTPNDLKSDTLLSWNTHAGTCEIIAAFLGAAIGLGTDIVMPWLTDLINPITGAVGAFSTILILKGTESPDLPPVEDCKQVSDNELICHKTFKAISTPFGSLSFESIEVFTDGLGLQGQLTSNPVGTAAAVFNIQNALFWDSPSFSCAEIGPSLIKEVVANPQNYARVKAVITIESASVAPVYIFYAQVIGDNQNIFPKSFAIAAPQTPATITVDLPYPGDAYFASPYPLQILIATSGGIRLISLGDIPPLSQQDVNAMIVGIGAQLNRCKEMVNNNFLGKYRARWSIDPYPGQKLYHYYQIEVNGLERGSRIRIADSQGTNLQVVHSVQPGTFAASVMTRVVTSDFLEIIPEKAEQAARDTEELHPSLVVTQQELVTMSGIGIASGTKQVLACVDKNSPMVFTVNDDEIFGYDISNPYIPVLATRIRCDGMNGLLPFRGKLAAFGKNGLSIVGEKNNKNACCESGNILSAQFAGGSLYALTNEGLGMYSNDLKRITLLDHEENQAGQVVFSRNRLLVVSNGSLKEYKVIPGRKPLLMATHTNLPEIKRAIIPPVSQGLELLLIFDKEAACSYRFTEGKLPVKLAEYTVLPWWTSANFLNGYLALWENDKNMVTLNYFGRSKFTSPGTQN